MPIKYPEFFLQKFGEKNQRINERYKIFMTWMQKTKKWFDGNGTKHPINNKLPLSQTIS